MTATCDQFMDLTTPHLPRLFRIGMRLTHQPSEAQDLVQEALTKAWANWSRFEQSGSLGAWLSRILINTFISRHRHQKVVEETPSPAVGPELRARMFDAACAAATAVGYVGAGTVEFLLDRTGHFYFLEMNTRLQVEHPVSEMTTGRDLVWDMIRVAAGEPLGYSQAQVKLDGHAIECRIYAEDGLRFLPSPGPLLRLRWPEGPGLRIDAAVREGSEVSSHYDPMIAKLVAWGPTRAIAIERMRRALEDTVVLGIDCNIGFHLRVLAEPDFRAGHFDTHYIDTHPDLVVARELEDERSRAIAAAAAVSAAAGRASTRASAGSGDNAGFTAWQRSARWQR
ncbi:MAG: hypothetical protein KC457_17050 [Myxococcales bacterium]|nr:hypothetical protein [Myxococcales bacterium]